MALTPSGAGAVRARITHLSGPREVPYSDNLRLTKSRLAPRVDPGASSTNLNIFYECRMKLSFMLMASADALEMVANLRFVQCQIQCGLSSHEILKTPLYGRVLKVTALPPSSRVGTCTTAGV